MSDSFTLPLRPLLEKRERPDTLPQEIAQINAQWGSFRDVTEESLRAKIEEEKNRDPWAEEDEIDKATADVDTAERMDQLYKRRAEITQFAMQAHMEALFALDFVSLLLSKHTPRQAELSMSAYLKQVAPLGSLNAEIVNPPPKSDAALQDIKTVSRGWRLQNFNAAANKLLKSATRLETEVAAETKYWNEVLAVKDKGWKVCRLPRDRQALGVQYGFLEATPIFRDRGLAALRRADDGSLLLDKGLIPQRARTVRVRIRTQGQYTGCSKVSWSLPSADSIESRILQARDTVYEEELFHEMVRESRIMGSQGVTTRQNLVQVPVSDEQEVLLDLVDVDQSEPTDTETHSNEHDTLADAVAHSVRILLAYAHRQNLWRRTQPPPPLSQKRRHTPEYQLLRPVMAYLQHTAHVRSLESFMNDLRKVMKAAGLRCDFTSAPFSSVRLPQTRSSMPKVETLVKQFLMPFESMFTGNLITPESSFCVKVRTNTVSSSSGTYYEISVNLPHHREVQPPSRIGLQTEAAAAIIHFAMLDIVTAISHKGTKSPKEGADAGKGVLRWEVAYAHHGELRALSSSGNNKKMKVRLSREELTIQTFPLRGLDGSRGVDEDKRSANLRSQSWTLDSSVPRPSVMEFVEEVSQDRP
ncbi:mediator of RNA polymerase II transcription subunit 17 [Aspergillus homomorphus CBS 101889]|uniref:Mediator of RNA polymerase II transcription subunit 17 n=1 Tax=Aspergillus homomorphus (strain CBS 101889) TaxID=1450537 RepID=A0A395I3B5_ASPHC|nr:mediator of RNA polymerase II transcription subunit 17 [Aspergillus homomorphus CBS 101889]RAL14103.1 mediator of RNA polymerase II transcription subunit 17 [Aspergillus homomorphus CBS 101889]